MTTEDIQSDTEKLTRDIHNAAINAALDIINSRIAAFTSQAKGIGPNADSANASLTSHTITAGLVKALLQE